MSFPYRLICACVLTSLTQAQTTLPGSGGDHDHDHDEPVHLGDFVVTTHPYARSQTEIAQPTSVVGSESVRRNQAASFGDLLANEPGVSSTYFGPGSSRPVIRALSGPRVSVLQNGTDTIDASVISPDHAVSIDPLLIERVEVTRGPAALLQGGAAIGGAVNVVTHRIHQQAPEPGVHGRAETRYASANDEWSNGFLFEGSSGALAWHVDGFHRETGDIDIPGFAESARLRALEAEEEHDHDEEEEEEAFGTVPNTFVESSGAAVGLSWINERGYVGFSFNGFDTNYGIPPGAHSHEHGHEDEHHDEDEDHDHEDEDHDEDEEHDEHEDEEGHDEHEHGEELVSIDLRQRRLELEGELRGPLPGWTALRWRAAYADYRHTELEGDEVGTVFTNEGYDLRIDALHEPWGGLQGAVGAKFGASEFTAVGAEAFLPATDSREFALFIFEEIETGSTLWQFGGRSDWNAIDVRDGSGRSFSGHAFSGSLGFVQPLNERWSFAASLAHTERLPTAQELYADGPHIGTNAYELGDPSLDHELSNGIDLTLRHRGDRVSAELTVFANQFDGYIYENPTGEEEDELPVYAFVQRDARLHGAEARAVFHVINDDNGHLDLTVGGDFVRARNTSDRTDLPRTTPSRLFAALDWHRGGWRAGTTVRHVLEQERLAPGEIGTDSHTLWSAYAGYRWITGRGNWDLLLQGKNLGNAEARVHSSFLKDVVPLAGRSIDVSLRVTF